MQSTLLDQALELLIFGMGTVFVFLALLVVAVNLMSRLIDTYFPEPAAPEPHTPKIKAVTPAIDDTTLAVIQAAIRQHRAKITRAAD